MKTVLVPTMGAGSVWILAWEKTTEIWDMWRSPRTARIPIKTPIESAEGILKDHQRDVKLGIHITQLQKISIQPTLRTGNMELAVSLVGNIKVRRLEQEEITGANQSFVKVRLHHKLGD
ncbi:MAG: hypothetical protein Q9218_002060 [Villophora microphyllina]